MYPLLRLYATKPLPVDLRRHLVEHGVIEFHAQTGFRGSVHAAVFGYAELVLYVGAVAGPLRHCHLEPNIFWPCQLPVKTDAPAAAFSPAFLCPFPPQVFAP